MPIKKRICEKYEVTNIGKHDNQKNQRKRTKSKKRLNYKGKISESQTIDYQRLVSCLYHCWYCLQIASFFPFSFSHNNFETFLHGHFAIHIVEWQAIAHKIVMWYACKSLFVLCEKGQCFYSFISKVYGGVPLPNFIPKFEWKTENVCIKCNSMDWWTSSALHKSPISKCTLLNWFIRSFMRFVSLKYFKCFLIKL